MARCPLLNCSMALGTDPGLGLGRGRERAEDGASDMGVKNKDPEPAKVADTIYGVKVNSGPEGS